MSYSVSSAVRSEFEPSYLLFEVSYVFSPRFTVVIHHGQRAPLDKIFPESFLYTTNPFSNPKIRYHTEHIQISAAMNAQSSSLAQGRGAASLQIGDLQDGNQVLGSLMGNTENHAEATNFPDGLHSPFTHLTYSENQELFDTRPINDSDNLTSMNTSQAVPQQQSNSDFSTAYTFSPRMNTHRVSKSEDEDFVPGSIPSTDSSKKKRSRRKKNGESSFK